MSDGDSPGFSEPGNSLSSRIRLALVFLAVLVTVVFVAFLYNHYETEHTKKYQYASLESISRLKTDQIVNWRTEQIQDALRFSRNPSFVKKLSEWIKYPDNIDIEKEIHDRCVREQKAEGFAEVIITDLEGKMLLSTEHDNSIVNPEVRQAIKEVVSIGQARLSDLYMSPSGKVRLATIAPVLNEAGKPFAAVLMIIDAETSLYPIITSWPTPSLTAESLLVRKDGSHIISMSELRHRPDSALTFSLPLDTPNSPAAHAISGKRGIFEGRDYRGKDVVAHLGQVPDSSWFMVTKIDRSEILADAFYHSTVIALFAGFMIVLTGLFIGYIYKSRQSDIYRKLYKAQQEKKEADQGKEEIFQRLQLALKGANLGIWDWYVQTGELHQDDAWHAQLGYAMDDVEKNLTSWQSRMHPDDRPIVTKAFKDCLSGRVPFCSVEHRLLTKAGDWKWTLTRGQVLERDEEGLPVRMVGTHLDIDKSKRSEEALKESNRMFRFITDTIQDVFYIRDPFIGKMLYVSPTYERLWEQKIEDLLGNPGLFIDTIHPDDVERVKQVLSQSHDDAVGYSIEYRLKPTSGCVRWILDRGYPIRGEDGALEMVCGTCSDITERKQAEEETRKFKTISEKSHYGLTVADPDGAILYVNEAFARMHGYSVSECLGTNISSFHSADQLPVIRQSIKRTLDNGADELPELWHKRKDGSMFPTMMQGVAITDAKGRPSFISATVIDITEQKKAEQDLIDREELFRTVFYTSPDAITISNSQDGTYADVNERFTELTGYTRQELAGKTSIDIGLWANPDDLEHVRREIYSIGKLTNYETQFRMKDGRVKTGLMSAKLFEINRIPHVLSVVRDIDDFKKTQAEYARLATAVHQAAERVIITTPDGKIVYVNPAFEVSTGYSREEALGQAPGIISSGQHDEAFFKELWDTISSGNVWRGHLINRRKDGTFLYEHSTISPVRDSSGAIVNYVQIASDITQEENLRQQLTQSQKMEAIGTLAGGIAHDFNNIIQAIMGYTELVMDDLTPNTRAHANLGKVMNAAQRSRDMVKQILAFSRRSELEVTAIEMSPLVKEGIKFLRAAIPPTIAIKGSIEPDVGQVMADPTQMHQVLMNLCVNASQAMKDKKGAVRVELDRVDLDADFVAHHPPLAPGKHVRLRVSDTGAGISSEILDKIFDPYFTTKESGEGTGLGLSVVHGIVTSFEGAITVSSELGVGTTFTVYLPLIDGQKPEALLEADSVARIRGTEHVLVVDDELVLLDIYEKRLTSLGYKVTKTSSPREALNLLMEKTTQPFDVLVTDMMMPEMSGMELAEKMALSRPEIPVIICTGWSDRLPETEMKQLKIGCIVPKPAGKNEIAMAIRKALDEPSV